MKGTLALACSIFGLGFLATACGGGGEGVEVSSSPISGSSPVATATVTAIPGQPTAQPTVGGTPSPVQPTAEAELTAEDEIEGWKTYTSEKFGYTLKYPGDAEIMGANLDASVQFVGPLVENEYWPVLTVQHGDGDFSHPPTGTDVHQWVIDFGVPYDEIGPEFEVAGLPTVHLIHMRSPQSYASDGYYFIKDNQLFHIQILHAGDRQDWDLYNKFLKSFAFP